MPDDPLPSSDDADGANDEPELPSLPRTARRALRAMLGLPSDRISDGEESDGDIGDSR